MRYVLEGSVRKSGNRVRINGQLIDATTGRTSGRSASRAPWTIFSSCRTGWRKASSRRYRTAGRTGEMSAPSASRRKASTPTDYYLRGMAKLHSGTHEASRPHCPCSYRAIELDQEFASAYAGAAWWLFLAQIERLDGRSGAEIAEGARLARRAVELGRDDA